jgi:hypothetical protein
MGACQQALSLYIHHVRVGQHVAMVLLLHVSKKGFQPCVMWHKRCMESWPAAVVVLLTSCCALLRREQQKT